ncbi:hypothetical protein RB195_002434 [Necator americanus]|uniref:C2H2-type domain-containing protein n=1 Tax=Necator americanus TaxID=51031 RepID=A0ABR1DJ10_NECAM
MHSGARSYPCTWPDCGKTFASSEHLRKHLRNIHQPAKLKCSRCGSVYSSSSALRRHERIHSNRRRYICARCGAGFDLRSLRQEQYVGGIELVTINIRNIHQPKKHGGVCSQAFSY